MDNTKPMVKQMALVKLWGTQNRIKYCEYTKEISREESRLASLGKTQEWVCQKEPLEYIIWMHITANEQKLLIFKCFSGDHYKGELRDPVILVRNPVSLGIFPSSSFLLSSVFRKTAWSNHFYQVLVYFTLLMIVYLCFFLSLDLAVPRNVTSLPLLQPLDRQSLDHSVLH